jgi:hypothetical protein
MSTNLADMGRILLGIGAGIALLGAVLIFAGRLGLPLRRLPGDIAYRGKNVSIFVPLGTSLLVSVILSLLLYLISHFRK